MRLTHRIPARISWWAEADFVPMTYGIAGLAILLLLAMDEALWGVGGMVEWFLPARAFVAHRQAGAWMAAALAVTWIVNSILLHGWIEKRMAPPLPCRPRVILLRFIAGGMPLLGLYVLPIWRRLLDRRRR